MAAASIQMAIGAKENERHSINEINGSSMATKWQAEKA